MGLFGTIKSIVGPPDWIQQHKEDDIAYIKRFLINYLIPAHNLDDEKYFSGDLYWHYEDVVLKTMVPELFYSRPCDMFRTIDVVFDTVQ
eukprot:UN05644